MRRWIQPWQIKLACTLVLLSLAGCTSFRDYVHNGFKVGPAYNPPPAPVAQHWIDANDVRVRQTSDDLSCWWTVFRDPVLDDLINNAYRQNLTLEQAGSRVLQARALLGITVGEVFPQQQDAFGSYRRVGAPFSNQWNFGFSLAWELDFWGRFRRAVDAAEDTLDASVEDYDNVLVTLLSDVATNYVQVRTFQQQIVYQRNNAKLQRDILNLAEARFQAGSKDKLDVDQALSTLKQTEAQIPVFEAGLRQAQNRICVLLGMPPVDLEARMGVGPIPTCPTSVAVGIPCQLLIRRPDVRRAERLAAAQAQAIGIAMSDYYPHISIGGTLGWQAQKLSDLFKSSSLASSVGPSFQWNVLNYGRILNNVRFQEAAFQELVFAYQQTVLSAAAEAENGLVSFLKAQEAERLVAESVVASQDAVNLIARQYSVGKVDFNRLILIQQNLVQQQNSAAQAQGQIALGLIQVYRALGGGWQIRLAQPGAMAGVVPEATPAPNPTPSPAPQPGPTVPKPPAPQVNRAPAARMEASRPVPAAELPLAPQPPARPAVSVTVRPTTGA